MLKPQLSVAVVCSLLAGLYLSVRQMEATHRFSAGPLLVTAGALIMMVLRLKERGCGASQPALLEDQVCTTLQDSFQ